MPLDPRLDCLKTAVNEDWNELEAVEANGELVIKVKEPVKFDALRPEPVAKKQKVGRTISLARSE